uniref:ATP-binding cassette domain-containing protein n=1 Tax=Gracilinema caldarium TaxID=215591 RepID=A0A7C3EF50_9SPIR
MIALQDCTVVFNANTPDERKALNEVRLMIERGDFVTVIGSNGAGKSTLLNLIAGSVRPSSGTIVIDGVDRTGEPEYLRARSIGRVFQDPLAGTAAEMTVEDNLAVAARKGRKPLTIAMTRSRKAEFRDRLAELGIGLENRMKENVSRLSGGQRQALTLLMAVIARPSILLLDEHTAALDPANAEKVLELTQRFAQEYELSVLMVTHDMARAITIGNRLIMMDKGEIIMDVSGTEKSSLTVDALVHRFREIRKQEFAGDRALLVE